MAVLFYDENSYIFNMTNGLEAKVSEAIPSVEGLTAATKDPIPPSSVLKQLALAVEPLARAGRKAKSLKDFIASSASSSPVRGRSGLSLTEFSNDGKVAYLIKSLFDPEGEFLRRKINSGSGETAATSLPRDIHGAPPESLVVKLAEVVGNFKTLRKMALFWRRVVVELRKLWSEEQHLPAVPLDDIPDLKSCLLYQQFQVINCCISRKRRHYIATESMDLMLMEASSYIKESVDYNDRIPSSPFLYARLGTGKLVLRLGADCPSGDLTLLETGEPVYTPVTQEGPLLTEDLIKETEEFVLQTGSLGVGCSQLLSDMQAFKAANPGCILEDFIRWYSPPDWTESEASTEADDFFDAGDPLSTRGQLSRRMQKEGNLWRELWETAKAVPAIKQAPLFDEDLAVEDILNAFEDIQPSELFEQLFVSLFGSGFAIAEPILSGNSDFSKLFYDCKEYVVATCQTNNWSEKVDELCQVYELVETLLLNPEKALKMIKQTTGEPKRQFKRLSLIFGGKDKLLRKSASTGQIYSEGKPVRQSFSNFFDSKPSFFSNKPRKTGSPFLAGKPPFPESDWTVVVTKFL